MTGILGVLLALAALIWLAYRGVSILVLAPAVALVAVVTSEGAPILASYTQVFMASAAGFIALYFPLFLLGAIFGKLMEDTGSARAIADRTVAWLGEARAILAVVLSCAVLTYGGVSLFVVAFAVYPIAAALFRAADIPKRLIPATVALGAFTFTMTALPGTPAIQNAIPMPFFGTTPFAAPGLGILTGVAMLALGMAWLLRRERQARAAGEGYGRHADAEEAPRVDRDLREHAQGEGFDLAELEDPTPAPAARPAFAIALAPIVLVVALNYAFSAWIIPAMDTGYLTQPEYGATTVQSVIGIWSIIAALTLSNLVLIALHWRALASPKRTIDDGASASVLPIFNTASLVGFGAVIASLPAFLLIRDAVLGLSGLNPLVSLAVAVNVLAGITGSASGGMSIALQTLGGEFAELGAATGISAELMHRVTAVATGGLDALPHNGAVITLLAICRLTHRESYGDLFVVAVLVPIVALALLIAMGSLVGTF